MDALIKREKQAVADPVGAFQKSIKGVPMRPLMLQRMFGTDVLPLGKIIEVAGPTGSCKSLTSFFLMREFLAQGCHTVLVETENKFNPVLFGSVIGDLAPDAVIVPNQSTHEKWQEAVTNIIKAVEDSVKAARSDIKEWEKSKKKDKGPRPPQARPVLLVLDSLASVSEASKNAILKDGHASRSFPEEALLNSRFFTALPEQLADLPMTMIYVNHKMKSMETGNAFSVSDAPTNRSKGGDTPAFFASHRLFFNESGAVTSPRQGYYEQAARCVVVKNSFNQKGITTKFNVWWRKGVDESTMDETQETGFHFDRALTRFLAPEKAGFDYDRDSVKKFLQVTFHSLTKYSVKGLVNGEGTAEEVGTMIEACPEACWRLTPHLGIKRFNAYEGLVKPYSKPGDPVDVPEASPDEPETDVDPVEEAVEGVNADA